MVFVSVSMATYPADSNSKAGDVEVFKTLHVDCLCTMLKQ